MTDQLSTAALEAALTPAEAQALFLAAEGLGYGEIADRLGISENAVACRLSGARQKLLRRQAERQTVRWQQAQERLPHEQEAWRRRLFDEGLRHAEG